MSDNSTGDRYLTKYIRAEETGRVYADDGKGMWVPVIDVEFPMLVRDDDENLLMIKPENVSHPLPEPPSKSKVEQ